MKMLLTFGMIAALAFVGVGMAAIPTAEAIGEDVHFRVQCVSVYQQYPDGSRYYILYPTCVGV